MRFSVAVEMGASGGRAWHGVELRHFVALETIARERSFSAAAFSLGYTQSAISGQITALERLVGATLFERLPGSRGVALTDEGRVLVEHAEAITSRLHAARADLEAMRAGGDRAGALRIGTFQSISMTLLPKILSRLAHETTPPATSLRELQDTAQLLELVAQGDLDVTFTTLPLPPGPFESTELLRDPYCLAPVHSDSPLAARHTAVAIEELAELPVIALERCLAQQLIEDGLRAAGVTPNIVTRTRGLRVDLRARRGKARRRPHPVARCLARPWADGPPTRRAHATPHPRSRVACRPVRAGAIEQFIQIAQTVAAFRAPGARRRHCLAPDSSTRLDGSRKCDQARGGPGWKIRA